jgi:glyoxylase-like metal-dependent hydrolase (beta-lactamase superfamily II)
MHASLEYAFDAPPPAGATIEVASGIRWLRMPLPFALDHINLWLIEEQAAWTLVDCGYGDAATRALWQSHFDATLRGRAITRIVATHYHPDHLGNAAWLAAQFAAPVAMTAAEFLTGHAVHAEHPGYSPADTSELFRAHGLADTHAAALRARGNPYRRGVPDIPHTFRRIMPDAAPRLGGEDWRLVLGYGHSPEHASFYSPARRVLISGDMLLPRISTNVSVWPSEPEADPIARFLDSLAAFEALPDDTLVLPSHGLPFRGIRARVGALRAHHAARLEELIEAMRERSDPASAADVVPVLFRRELDLQQRYFAFGEAIAHLNHLVATGIAARRSEEGAIRFALSRDGQPA